MSENKHTLEPMFQYDFEQLARYENGRTPVLLTAEQYRRARACVNACAGSSTEWLEFSVSEDCADLSGPFEPLETRITSILKTGIAYMVERDKMRKQRDELLAALEKYLTVMAQCGGGDKQLFMAAIREADDKARAVIASVKGGAA